MRKIFSGFIPVLTMFCAVLILLPVYFMGVEAQTATPASTKTPTPLPQKSSVGGTVFNDLNSNQVQNTFPLYESGIVGWKVFIYDTSWNKLATTQTAAQGRYSIRGLGAGTYYVCEEIKSGWSQTAPGVGAPNTIVAVPSEASNSNCGVILVNGSVQDIKTVNFGDIHQVQQPTSTPLPTTPISPTVTITPTGATIQPPTVVSICSPNGGNHWIVTNPNNVQLTLTYYFSNGTTQTQSYIKFLNSNSSTELFVSSEFTNLSLTAFSGFTQFQLDVPYDSLVCGTPTPTLTPSETPTEFPTETPTDTPVPTDEPTPTDIPTETPTEVPTEYPTQEPTITDTPYETPTDYPTETPTDTPTDTPYETPTEMPTEYPTDTPYETPTEEPTPTDTPYESPTEAPTETPYETPTEFPTETPTDTPVPTDEPTQTPTEEPSPTTIVTDEPTPTDTPYETPTEEPSQEPTVTETPTETPTDEPTQTPTDTPEPSPTPTSAFTGNSQISGNLFIDETNDGEYNPELGEEILQESVLVSLYDSFWNLIQTQDIQDGVFSFSSLAAGDYRICALASTGWTQTAPYLSSPNYTSVMAPAPISKPCYVINVDGNSSSTGHFFGYF